MLLRKLRMLGSSAENHWNIKEWREDFRENDEILDLLKNEYSYL